MGDANYQLVQLFLKKNHTCAAQQFGNLHDPQTRLWKKLSPKEPQWPEERVIPQEETQEARSPSRWKGLENGEESVEVLSWLRSDLELPSGYTQLDS